MLSATSRQETRIFAFPTHIGCKLFRKTYPLIFSFYMFTDSKLKNIRNFSIIVFMHLYALVSKCEVTHFCAKKSRKL